MQGRALLPASGLFELAAAAAGMLVACDALPPAATQDSLIASAAIAAPCVLAAGGTPQLLLCTVDAGWADFCVVFEQPSRLQEHQ